MAPMLHAQQHLLRTASLLYTIKMTHSTTTSNNHSPFRDRLGRTVLKPNHAPVSWRISVYALIVTVFHGERRVLMVVPRWAEQLELPGGGVEVGESLSVALQREVLEETGIFVHCDSTTPVALDQQLFFHDGEERYYQSILATYHCSPVSDDLPCESMIRADEISRTVWVGVETIRSNRLGPAVNRQALMRALSSEEASSLRH